MAIGWDIDALAYFLNGARDVGAIVYLMGVVRLPIDFVPSYPFPIAIDISFPFLPPGRDQEEMVASMSDPRRDLHPRMAIRLIGFEPSQRDGARSFYRPLFLHGHPCSALVYDIALVDWHQLWPIGPWLWDPFGEKRDYEKEA